MFWAADALGAHFMLAEGINHVRQPDAAIAAARAAFPGDPWSIAALHVVTTLTGSALLALALAHGVREPAEIWTAAYVDEDFNTEQWGLDEEVAARRAVRLVDFEAATRILRGDEGLTLWPRRRVNERFTPTGPLCWSGREGSRLTEVYAAAACRMAISVTPSLPYCRPRRSLRLRRNSCCSRARPSTPPC